MGLLYIAISAISDLVEASPNQLWNEKCNPGKSG